MNLTDLFSTERLFESSPNSTFAYTITFGVTLTILLVIVVRGIFTSPHLSESLQKTPQKRFLHRMYSHFLIYIAITTFFFIARITGIPYLSMRFLLLYSLLSLVFLGIYFLIEYFMDFEKFKLSYISNKTKEQYLPKRKR